MTCWSIIDEPENENILLSEEICYKNYLLNNNDKDIYDTIYLTKNSESQNLIGVSSVDQSSNWWIKYKKGLFNIKEFKKIINETISETFKKIVKEVSVAALNN